VRQDPLPQPDWVQARRRAIGRRIRGARLDAQLSQEELGELVGVDRRTVSGIEYGRTDPSLSVLLRLAYELRVPLDELLRTGSD
jgi:transcriptional regulator with XRE-family HTH domain